MRLQISLALLAATAGVAMAQGHSGGGHSGYSGGHSSSYSGGHYGGGSYHGGGSYGGGHYGGGYGGGGYGGGVSFGLGLDIPVGGYYDAPVYPVVPAGPYYYGSGPSVGLDFEIGGGHGYYGHSHYVGHGGWGHRR
jgi:hypothetical protein